MPPAACCHGLCRLAVGLPIDPPEVRLAPDARPTWLNRDVAEVEVWCSDVGPPTTIGTINVDGRSTTIKTTISVLVRGSSPSVTGRVIVLRGKMDPGMSLSHRRVVTSSSWSTDYDVNLSFDQLSSVRSLIPFWMPIRVVSLFSDVIAEVP
ncbi:hypothetical protein BHM03_00011813 [Ensete ventricosum]|uniref:Uncharacterized protein n=1 Tax=Ensete ventricosum TaxID=4639 RepID=A0A445MDI1_ENSVE|nr:hypothetical protein BHM03_00011813 [Ensete ventricosum]